LPTKKKPKKKNVSKITADKRRDRKPGQGGGAASRCAKKNHKKRRVSDRKGGGRRGVSKERCLRKKASSEKKRLPGHGCQTSAEVQGGALRVAKRSGNPDGRAHQKGEKGRPLFLYRVRIPKSTSAIGGRGFIKEKWWCQKEVRRRFLSSDFVAKKKILESHRLFLFVLHI